MKWTNLSDYSGEQTFIVDGGKIAPIGDPSTVGYYSEDGSIVFYDTKDMGFPVAVWERQGKIIELLWLIGYE